MCKISFSLCLETLRKKRPYKEFFLVRIFLHSVRIQKNTNFFLLPLVKSVQIRSFFWSVFSRIRTEHGERFFILLWNNMTLNSHSEFSNTTLVSFIQPRSLEDILHSCRNVRAYKINIMTAKSTK